MRYNRANVVSKLREIADDIENGSVVCARVTSSILPTTYTHTNKETGVMRTYEQTLNNVIIDVSYEGEVYGV